jgi:hypothetical protein
LGREHEMKSSGDHYRGTNNATPTHQSCTCIPLPSGTNRLVQLFCYVQGTSRPSRVFWAYIIHVYAFFIILFSSCSIWWLCCLVDVCIRCGVGIDTASREMPNGVGRKARTLARCRVISWLRACLQSLKDEHDHSP